MKRASSTISISLVALGWFLCGLAGVASAQKSAARQDDCQQKPECAEHLGRGIKDYQQKRYPQAMQSFEKALTLSNDPRLLVLLGRTNFKLDNARAALGFYERAAAENMSNADRAKLEQYVAEARAAVGPEKPPVLEAPVAPPPPLPPKEEKKMKPWMWAIIGVAGAAVVGTAVGVGVYYGTGQPTPDVTLRFP